MVKRIIAVLLVLLVVFLAGCSLGSQTTTTAATAEAADVKQVRQAEIGGKWAVKQIEINLKSSFSILLTLAPGDSVEGYFYLVKGDNVKFEVSGKSLIYKSQPASAKTEKITSDRFAFAASDAQGIAYTLMLDKGSADEDAGAKTTSVTVFMEIVYPLSGDIYIPMGTK